MGAIKVLVADNILQRPLFQYLLLWDAIPPGNFFDHPISASTFINDALIVFDDVFVPNERIFMKKEWPLAADIAYMFGNFHRLSAETYKAAELEILTGAAIAMAEYNGIERASHVQDKLSWLIQLRSRKPCRNMTVDFRS